MPEEVSKLCDRIQEADWHKEKHVPVIEIPDDIRPGAWAQVKISLGRAVEHPNTTEHHIRWVKCFFSPEGEKFTYELGRFEFNAHGEGLQGPNEGPVHTNHQVIFSFKTTKPGTLHALAMCNIHGLWESDKKVVLS